MRRETVTRLLAQAKPELQRRFGVTRLTLFGSTARDSARTDSDVDVLVSFDGPATAQRFSACSFFWKTCSGAQWIW
jgi:predicted nucleotidyltransferase